MTDGAPLADRVAAIWQKFRPAIVERLVVLDEAAAALAGGRLDTDGRRAAFREAHKLAGSLGTFGFGVGSQLAREIEQMLNGESPLGEADATRLSTLLRALRNELGEPS